MTGKVYIIGVGPGDHKLITLKAAECIGKADVIVYDRLVNKSVLKFAKKDAELVYAGKSGGHHSMPQDEINGILVKKAKEGKIVARVKGGDPFLFGRGGEEAEWSRDNDIEFEVVPGVTSAIAVPAYAGIPVTHRDYCSSLHIITGHETPDKDGSKLDYEVLAKLEGTLVFLMGLKNLKRITEGLIKYGKDKNTPVAVIEKGTTPEQRVVEGTLETIVQNCESAEISSPAVIVIGAVAALKEKLCWFSNGKLAGKTVLVTRPEIQADSFVQKIEELCGNALEVPVITIDEPDDYTELDKALDNIKDYSWLAFTSSNGVRVFFKRLKERKLDIRILYGIKICAVGSATSSELYNLGLNVEYIPDEYTTAALLDGLKKIIKHEEKLLLVRAHVEDDELVKGLNETKIEYKNVPVYRAVTNWSVRDEMLEILKERDLDFITFTSPSTVRSFVEIMGHRNNDMLKEVKVVCIGPVTAKAAGEHGFKIDGVADVHTIDGLLDKMVQIVEG